MAWRVDVPAFGSARTRDDATRFRGGVVTTKMLGRSRYGHEQSRDFDDGFGAAAGGLAMRASQLARR